METFATAMEVVFHQLSGEDRLECQRRARISSKRFSEAEFESKLLECVGSYLLAA